MVWLVVWLVVWSMLYLVVSIFVSGLVPDPFSVRVSRQVNGLVSDLYIGLFNVMVSDE